MSGSGAGVSGGGAGTSAGGAPPAGAPPLPGAAIAVPSFREVQAAERARGPPSNPLRAGVAGAGGAALAMNPLAFLGGGGGGAAPTAPAPAHPPPQRPYRQQQQQQQQQQYYYPPAAPPLMQPRPPAPPPAYAAPPPPPAHLAAPSAGAATAPAARDPPPNPATITVSRRQEGNPVLRLLRHARWQFGDVAPDFLLGAATAALFLSLRFHLLRPEYLHGRLRELGRAFRLRVVLVLVDAEDAAAPLADVTRACIAHEATLICAFSAQEAARYLETLKIYEKKPAEAIRRDPGADYVSRATAALTAVRGVNKTDVKTLGDRFGSVAAIFRAPASELRACPGVGPTKARRLAAALGEPFRRGGAAGAAPARVEAAPPVAAAAVEEEEEWPEPGEEELAAAAEAERGRGGGGGGGGGAPPPPTRLEAVLTQALGAGGEEDEEEGEEEGEFL